MKNAKRRIPVQKRSKEKKTLIIDAACKLFSAKGYYKTSSNEIAREAGVSIGTFYSYFKDKKQLFIEVLEKYNKHITGEITNGMHSDSKNIEHFLSQLIRVILEAHRYMPDFHRELEMMKLSEPDIQHIMIQQELAEIEMIRKWLDEQEYPLASGDSEAYAYMIHNLLEKTLHDIVFLHTTLDSERLLKALVDLLICFFERKGS
jgi:AcrR family transcriptional regulator